MADNVLVFSNDDLFKTFPDVDEMFPITDSMRNRDEIFYVYVIMGETWYKNYSIAQEKDVPSVYRTLKLMLTN